jgi:hypothetical protein
MTDCFFSYKSEDRERVRLVRDALDNLGFDVFWDQEVPPGSDWDNWIKLELQKSRGAIVFWSANSIHSPNVRQEATIAHNSGKLIQVLLAPLTPEQFPMGLYTTQAVNLIHWRGEPGDENWVQLTREIEARVAPRWIRNRLLGLENEIRTEQTRRQIAETREANLQQKFVEEIAANKIAQLETEEARASVEPLTSAVEGLMEGKRLAEASAVAVERKIGGVLASLDDLERRAGAIAKSSTPSGWRSARGPIIAVVVCALIIGGQSTFLLWMLARNPPIQQVTFREDKAIADLRSELGTLRTKMAAAEAAAAKLKELQVENIDLARKLEVAKGLADTNWVEAAIAIKAARAKLDSEQGDKTSKP